MKNIIYVENHTYVTASKYSVVFRNVISKEVKHIPLTDIEYIIFDHQNSYFSTKFIIQCKNFDIGVLFCDERHTPTSVLYSEYNYHLKWKRLKMQMELPKRVKNRLWQKIVKGKINNQSLCLQYTIKNSTHHSKLKEMEKTVQSNDKTFRESYASRIYFKELFPSNFKRGRYRDPINSALNYTYAIIRALIRKQLCAHGFEPSIGIQHCSDENPFNLSDDIIEPYRPFVDRYVHITIVQRNIQKLEQNAKKLLVQVLFEKCIIQNRVHYIGDAIKITVESLISCYENHTIKDLKIPQMIEGGA